MNLVDFVKERAKEFGKKVFLREKKDSLTYRDVADFCRRNLTSCKVPCQVEIRPDLPKSSTGKILHRELREEKKG
jgi:long-chain acyl-CoA synthetase